MKHFGEILRETRVAKGLGLEALAIELRLPPALLRSIEAGDWDALPPGRERPLARQVAERLGVDPLDHPGAWAGLPGHVDAEIATPRQDRMERLVMGLLTLGSVALVLWLVLPGPRLRTKTPPVTFNTVNRGPIPPPPPPAKGPFPVLGELLPEAPVNEEGILVSLRAQDASEARIQAQDGFDQTRTLQVSDPWKLRVKGPFTLTLGNAGVVAVDVAGQAIPHGKAVGEVWTATFDAQGRWEKPAPPPIPKGTAPESDEDDGDAQADTE